MVQTPEMEDSAPKRKICIACKQEFTGDEVTCPFDGTTLTPLTMETSVGSTIGDKYEILAVIGGGAMGLVYKARHMLMKRIVAIKMLHPNMLPDAATVKRFQKEAEALSCLNHPNILTVFDFGVSTQGHPYLVTDYLEGQTIGELLEQNQRLDWPRTIKIFMQVCSALAHAHKNGVVHRDIKPSNIMLTEFEDNVDFVKILDFGIAKVLNEMSEDSSQLTRTGEVFGSPLYMSPEQCRGKPLDARSDIYSLGCVLYRTLTGQPAFFGQDLVECLYKHVNEEPVPMIEVVPEADLPPELDQVVLKCLSKDPSARFQTMPELKEALANIIGVSSASGVMSVNTDAWLQSGQLVQSLTSMQQAGTPSFPPQKSQSDPTLAQPEATTRNALVDSAGSADRLSTPLLENSDAEPDLKQSLGGQASTSNTNDFHQAISRTSQIAQDPEISARVPADGSAGTKKLIIGVAAGVVLLLLILVPGVVSLLKATKPENSSSSGSRQPASDLAGKKDPYDLSMYQGIQEYESGEYAEAQGQFKKAIREAQRSKLPADKLTNALHYMITSLGEAGQYTEAEAFVTELERESKTGMHGQTPTTTAAAEACLDRASLLLKSSAETDRERAKNLLNEALKYFQSKPETNADEMRTLAKLGQLSLMGGELDQAQKLMQEAVKIAESDGKVSQLELALRMEQLGDTYVLLANNMDNGGKYYDAAQQLYNRALQLRITNLKSEDHPALAQSYKRIGVMYYLRGQYENALKELNKSLEIRRRQNKPYQLAEIERAISYVYLKEKKFTEADRMFKESIAAAKMAGPSAASEIKNWQAGFNRLKKSVR